MLQARACTAGACWAARGKASKIKEISRANGLPVSGTNFRYYPFASFSREEDQLRARILPGRSESYTMSSTLIKCPAFCFFHHVAVAVKPGELESHVRAYQAMGFREVHR